MKIVITATIATVVLAVLVLMIGCFTCGKTSAQSAYAISDYQSGFQHGISDAKCVHQPGCDYYITQPGKGFQFHTRDFIHGFVNGYCSITWPPESTATDAGFDADEASFSCREGPSSANWVSNN